MKKVVKSKRDLDKMALSHGATVTDRSGRTFNTAKKKSTVKRLRPEPRTEAPPAPKPDKSAEILGEKVDAASKAHLAMMQQLREQIAQIQLSAPEPITEWVFDMVRDDKGYLKQIKATATQSRPVMN